MAWGLGPVFDAERKIDARRWQVYAGRSAFVLALLVGMATIWWSYMDDRWTASIRGQAELGRAYFYAIVGVQLALTMIVAPATTAGAVCVERSTGSLALVLVTDLRAPEIVLGKLAARLLPTFAVVACTWPVAALGSLLGGIDPQGLAMAFAITLAVGLLGCTLALALSVWATSVREVLLVVYTFWAIVLLAYPVGLSFSFSIGVGFARRWMLTVHPFWMAFASYLEPGRNGPEEYGVFFAAALGLSAACAVLAILGLRVNPLGESRPRRRARFALSAIGRATRRLPGPSLDGNPVFWREWHRGRVSRPLGILMAALLLAGTAACTHGAFEIFTQGQNNRGVGFAGAMGAMVQIVFGLLVVGVLASLSFSEERRRGNLDVLLATPLSTRAIVRGKWLGAFRIVPLLAIGPSLVAVAFAQDDLRQILATTPAALRPFIDTMGPWERALGAALMPLTILAHGAWITSLGLSVTVSIRQEVRALSLVIAVYVLVVIGVPLIFLFLASPGSSGPTGEGAWLIVSTPVLAGLELLELLSTRPQGSVPILASMAAWDGLAALVAFFRFEATVRMFDRKFDRLPEAPVVRRPSWRSGRRIFPSLKGVGTPSGQRTGSGTGSLPATWSG